MQLHDTLTKQLNDVEPVDGVITLYTCGPTVYDYPHIGNWYAFIRWDALNRALRIDTEKVQWIMNITDVGHLVSDDDDGEDKLEKGAKREGKTAWDVAKYYGDYFINGLKRLNFSDIHMLPKATEHIPEQIDLVAELESKGFTYTIDDGVYFDTSRLKDYGKLAHLDIEKLKAGARVELNPQKRNVTDFALWKFSPKNEKRDMEWDSPWGVGFPGWHIECSAMSMKYFGPTLSIHAGGIDHIPVHHTNEIAQSEAATGKPFAKTWVHSNFILVDGKKMSKSLGNFYTLEDIEKKGYDLETFRLAVLSSHYQSEAEFSWDTMHAACVRLRRFKDFASLQHQDTGTKLRLSYDHQAIQKHLSDNLNTPQVIAELDAIAQSSLEEGVCDTQKQEHHNYLQFIDKALGLQLSSIPDIDDNAKAILASRNKARASKDWASSDKLRNELAALGIGVRDTSVGQIWSWL
jgi:cysteinyl-tRNA synthetase